MKKIFMAAKNKKKEFENEKQVFSEHIQKSGLRHTAQRDLILEIFLRTEEHLSSENLYWLVKTEDPTVGQTTVYRTLKLLTEAGLAREVRFGDGKTYYEHHYNHEHHDHMICIECGTVVEFFSPEIENLQDAVATEYGFKLTQHSMRIFGVCGECQNKASEMQNSLAASGAQPRIRVAARADK